MNRDLEAYALPYVIPEGVEELIGRPKSTNKYGYEYHTCIVGAACASDVELQKWVEYVKTAFAESLQKTLLQPGAKAIEWRVKPWFETAYADTRITGRGEEEPMPEDQRYRVRIRCRFLVRGRNISYSAFGEALKPEFA